MRSRATARRGTGTAFRHLLAPLLCLGLIVPGAVLASSSTELPPLQLAATSGADLVPLVRPESRPISGRDVTSTVVVVNAGGSRATGHVDLLLDVPAEYGSAVFSGLGWTCSSATHRCGADLDLAAGASSEPVRATQHLPATVPGKASLTASLTTTVTQPKGNDSSGLSTDGVADPEIDLGVVAWPRGPVRSGDEALFDVSVLGLGTGQRSGPTSLVVTSGSLPVVRGTGTGWSCSPVSYGVRCSSAGSPAPGSSLPTLEIGTRDNGLPPSGDRNAPAITVQLDAVDAFPGNDQARASAPFVPAGGGDLLVAVSDDPSGRFAVTVSEAGSGSDGPVVVALTGDGPGGTVPDAGGEGWSCTTSGTTTCRRPGPVAAGESLPPLTVPASGSVTRQDLSATLLSGALPGEPTTVSASLEAPSGGPTVAVDDARGGRVGDTASALVRVTSSADPVRLQWYGDVGTKASDTADTGWSCTSQGSCEHAGSPDPLPALRLSTPVPPSGGATLRWSAELVGDVGSSLARAQASARTALAPVDLVVLATPGDAAPDGGRASTSVDVLNVGRVASSGPVTVKVTGGLALSGSGDGWTCIADVDACQTTASAPAGGRLPTLTLTDRSGGDGSFGAQVELIGAGVSRPRSAVATAVTPFSSTRDALTATVTPSAPLAPGRTVRSTVSVRNDGSEADPDAVTLFLDSPRGAGRASGAGWVCEEWSRCTHPGPVPAHSSLPPVDLDVTLPVDEPLGNDGILVRLGSPGPAGPPFDGQRSSAYLPIVTRTGPAGLQVQVTEDGDGMTRAGTSVPMTVRVTNPSSQDVAAPRLSLTPSRGLTLTPASSADWTCSGSTCQATRTFLPGDSRTLSLTGAVDTGAPSHTTLVAQATSGAVVASGSGTWLVPGRGADLVPVVNGQGPVAPGGTARFLVDVSNAGGDGATAPTNVRLAPSVSMLDTEDWTATGSGWSCAHDVCHFAGPVGAGQHLPPLAVAAPVDASSFGLGSSVTLKADLWSTDDGETADNTAVGEVAVVPADTVDLVPSVGLVAPVAPGGDASYDVAVRNVGTTRHDAAVWVDLTNLANATMDVHPTGQGWACHVLTCEYDQPVESGQPTAPLRVVASARYAGAGLGVVVRSLQDRRTGNNSASLTVPSGRTETLAVAVRPGTGAGTAVVSAASRERPVPGPVRLALRPAPLRVEGDGWSCQPGAYGYSTECAHAGDLAPRTRLPDLRVDLPTQEDGSAHLDVAPAEGAEPNGSASLDVPRQRLPVGSGPGLVAAMSADSPDGGRTGVATVVVRNPGTTTVPSDKVTAWVGGNNGLPDVSGSGWSCAPDGSGMTCTVTATLAPGAQLPPLTVRTVPAVDPTPREHAFHVTLFDSLNSMFVYPSASVLGLPGPADVRTSISAPPYVVGGTVGTYAVDVLNGGGTTTGGSVSVSLTAKEVFPAPPTPWYGSSTEVRAVTASGTGWTCDSSGRCTHAALAAGESATLTVAVPTGATGAAPLGSTLSLTATPSAPGAAPALSTVGVTRVHADPVPQLTADGPLITGRTSVLRGDVVMGVGPASSPVTATWTLPYNASSWTTRGSGTGWSCSGTTCTYAGAVAPGQHLPQLRIEIDLPPNTLPGSYLSLRELGVRLAVSSPSQASTADDSVGISVQIAVPLPATSPPSSAPTGVTAKAGNASALVSWSPASTAGSIVSAYRVTGSPGGLTCTTSGATSCTVSGLTNGTAYTFTVAAGNSSGYGPASAPSGSVTPAGGSDTTAPTITASAAPVFSLASTVGLAYTGADTGGSGVAGYDVRYRRAPYNGGFGVLTYPTTWQGTTASSVSLAAVAGTTTCLSVRSRDRAGNVSAWSAEGCTAAALDDRSLTASTGWARTTSSVYYAGTATTISRTASTLTLTGVQARRLAVVATTCPGCGTIAVSWNGTVVKYFNLAATTTTNKRILTAVDLGAVQTGTLVIKTTTAGPVVVDGVGLNRS